MKPLLHRADGPRWAYPSDRSTSWVRTSDQSYGAGHGAIQGNGSAGYFLDIAEKQGLEPMQRGLGRPGREGGPLLEASKATAQCEPHRAGQQRLGPVVGATRETDQRSATAGREVALLQERVERSVELERQEDASVGRAVEGRLLYAVGVDDRSVLPPRVSRRLEGRADRGALRKLDVKGRALEPVRRSVRVPSGFA